MTMVPKSAIVAILLLFGTVLTYGQGGPSDQKPVKEKRKKEIKNVPSAETKAKPAKISSSARPNSGKPNQPVQPGKQPSKVPAKGKPGGGKPPGR